MKLHDLKEGDVLCPMLSFGTPEDIIMVVLTNSCLKTIGRLLNNFPLIVLTGTDNRETLTYPYRVGFYEFGDDYTLVSPDLQVISAGKGNYTIHSPERPPRIMEVNTE